MERDFLYSLKDPPYIKYPRRDFYYRMYHRFYLAVCPNVFKFSPAPTIKVVKIWASPDKEVTYGDHMATKYILIFTKI